MIVVTDDGRLVKVVIEFDAEAYDLEQERGFREESPAHTVVEAWVRPLNDVVRLEMRKIRQRRDAFNQQTRNQFDVGDVRLRFRGDRSTSTRGRPVGTVVSRRPRTDRPVHHCDPRSHRAVTIGRDVANVVPAV